MAFFQGITRRVFKVSFQPKSFIIHNPISVILNGLCASTFPLDHRNISSHRWETKNIYNYSILVWKKAHSNFVLHFCIWKCQCSTGTMRLRVWILPEQSPHVRNVNSVVLPLKYPFTLWKVFLLKNYTVCGSTHDRTR